MSWVWIFMVDSDSLGCLVMETTWWHFGIVEQILLWPWIKTVYIGEKRAHFLGKNLTGCFIIREVGVTNGHMRSENDHTIMVRDNTHHFVSNTAMFIMIYYIFVMDSNWKYCRISLKTGLFLTKEIQIISWLT